MLVSPGLESLDPPNDWSAGPAPLPLPPLPPQQYPFLAYFGPQPGGGPPPPRVWTVFITFKVAFLTFVAIQVVALTIAVGVIFNREGSVNSAEDLATALQQMIVQPQIVLLLATLTQLSILGVVLCAVYLSPVPMKKRMRLGPSRLPWLGYPLVLAGGLAIGVLYGAIAELVMKWLHARPGGTVKLLQDVLTHLTPAQTVAAVIVVGILPGIAEEWLFRGYMQTRLSRRLGRWWAIGISAFLFGLMHLDLVQSPFAAAFGVYLGYIAEKSGSIRPTMLCHMVNNTLQVLLASLVHGEPSAAWGWALLAGSAVVLLGAIVYLRFAVQPPVETSAELAPQETPARFDASVAVPPMATA